MNSSGSVFHVYSTKPLSRSQVLQNDKKFSLQDQNQLSGFGCFCVHMLCLWWRWGQRSETWKVVASISGVSVGLSTRELGKPGAYGPLLLNLTARETPNLTGNVPGGDGRLL